MGLWRTTISQDCKTSRPHRDAVQPVSHRSHIRWSAFFRELGKRRVVQVALAYAGVSWLLIQVADTAVDAFDLPLWLLKLAFVILFLGFPIIIILTWVFDLGPRGLTASSEPRNLVTDSTDTQGTGTLCLLCAEIVGYEAVKASHSGEAENLLNYTYASIRPLLANCEGEFVKTLGDSIISTFRSPEQALSCALQVQHKLQHSGDLSIRISLHYGDCVRDGNLVAGDSVNECLHLGAVAEPGGIVVSESFRSQLDKNDPRSAGADWRQVSSEAPGTPSGFTLDPAAVRHAGECLVTAHPPPVPPATSHLPRRAKLLTSLALVLFLTGGFYFYKDYFSELINFEEVPSLAILPFANVTGDASLAYLSDGLTDELINLTSRIPSLRVASRTSTYALQGKSYNAEELGERLGVDFFLEGSVRKDRDRMRVLVRLFDIEKNNAIWSQTYDLSLEEFFRTREEIARKTLAHLQIPSGEVPSRLLADTPTRDPKAMEIFLKGQEILRKPATMESLAQAEQRFQDALLMDANFLEAEAGLCEVYLARYQITASDTRFKTAESQCQRIETRASNAIDGLLSLTEFYLEASRYERARHYAEQALQNDRYNARARMLLGELQSLQNRPQEALQNFSEARSLDPGHWETHYYLGRHYYRTGDYQLALDSFRKAVQLEPDSANPYTNLGAVLLSTYDFAGAAAAFDKAVAIAPTRGGYSNSGAMHYYLGNYDKAVNLYLEALQLAPDDARLWGNLADAYFRIPGKTRQAQGAYAKAIERARKSMLLKAPDVEELTSLSWYLLRAGDATEAAQILDRAIAQAPQDPDVLIQQGMMYLEKQQTRLALESFNQAIDNGYSYELLSVLPDIPEPVRANFRQ